MKLQFYDGNKPLYIEVDTSKKGIGAVMLQDDSIVPNMAKSDEIPYHMPVKLFSQPNPTILTLNVNFWVFYLPQLISSILLTGDLYT